ATASGSAWAAVAPAPAAPAASAPSSSARRLQRPLPAAGSPGGTFFSVAISASLGAPVHVGRACLSKCSTPRWPPLEQREGHPCTTTRRLLRAAREIVSYCTI